MNIRRRLLVLLGIPFILSISISFFFIIQLTSNRVGIQLENQLEQQESSLTDQLSNQVLTSAKSYISAVGNVSSRNSSRVYKNYTNGKISKDEALSKIRDLLNNEKILDGGYIYVVDKDAKIVSHPDISKIGNISTTKDWLSKQSNSINSFYEYDYEGRQKLLYKIYNKDLKWNLMVSAYADDFSTTLDMNALNLIMNKIKIGKTGYPVLINVEGKILSHPNTSLLNSSILNILDVNGNSIFKRVIEEKNGNFNYSYKEPDGKIRDKFIYFGYEKNSKIIVCATGYVDDFYETVNIIIFIIVLSGILMILLLSILLFGIATSVSKPIQIFNTNIKDISEGEGDLTNRILIKTSGEISSMVGSFNKFIGTLQKLITNVKHASGKTVETKNQISTGVEETASALYEISTNITEIQKQTKHLNNNVQNSVDYSDEISSCATDLNNSIDEQSLMLQTSTAAITQMISSITNVDNITKSKRETATKLIESAKVGSEIIDKTQSAVQQVNNQLTNIQEMAKVISNIASQTNLLAMNAAIEAAHAGDAGKGFAVVADEIRKLAETSSHNSSKISDTLKIISSSIISADQLSQNTRESFSVLNTEIEDIVGALSEIATSTSELEVGGKDILISITGLEEASVTVNDRAILISKLSSNIKESMSETSNISLEVSTSIDEINQGTNGISESMQVVKDSIIDLEDTSNELNQSVNRFKV